jgi:hypothetical protein
MEEGSGDETYVPPGRRVNSNGTPLGATAGATLLRRSSRLRTTNLGDRLRREQQARDTETPAEGDGEDSLEADAIDGRDDGTTGPDESDDEADWEDEDAEDDDDDEALDCFPPEDLADLDHYVETDADALLNHLYGDHPHSNDGTHLEGGVGAASDALWQSHWRRVVQRRPLWYKPPQGRVGRLFIRTLTSILKGVRSRLWNSERVIVFPALVLYKAHGVTAAKDIRARIES